MVSVRADSPLLGFHQDEGETITRDPLHYPSPDYTRELSLEFDQSDNHSRGLDPVDELEDYYNPIPQSRSRSHSTASSTYLAFSSPSSRRASRLPSFSSTLDSPQPLPPQVIPALRERVSSRSLHKQPSSRSLRRTTTDSALSLLSSHHVSLAGIATPDSVRNAVYFDSDHLDSLLLAASSSPTTTSPPRPPFTHSPHPSASHIYIARPSSTGSQVYLGPSLSTPTSPQRRTFPSPSSDESSAACLELETPGTSPASASFDCTAEAESPALEPVQGRPSWDDSVFAPKVYIHAEDVDPRDEFDDDDAEFGYPGLDPQFDGDHTFTYGQRGNAGLAPPQCSRWSLGSSIDAIALENKEKVSKHRDSWTRKRDSPEKVHRKNGGRGGDKKMGKRERLVSFISSRFSAAPASASVPALAFAPVHIQGKGNVPNAKIHLDLEKELPRPLFDKALPPITRSSPSPPPVSSQTRPTLALTIPVPPPGSFTASFPIICSPSPSPSSAEPATASTPTSSSVLDSNGEEHGHAHSRAPSPFIAAPRPAEEDEVFVFTLTAPPSTEDSATALLSPTSVKTLIPAPTPAPSPTPSSPSTQAVFTPPPITYAYSYVDPPSPGLDPFRASVAEQPSTPQVEKEREVQKKRSRRSLGIRELAVRMGLASSYHTSQSPSPTSPTPPSSSLFSNPYPPPVPALSSIDTYAHHHDAAYPQTPSSPTKRRKGPKRKLVISGIEEGGYEAVREWCEGFGEVKEMRRVWSAAGEGKGSLVVDFRKASVAETVCKLQAQVYIRGAGSVSLSWCTKKRGRKAV